MDPILAIIPDLGPNGAAKQLSLLAPALAHIGISVHVATIGGEGIFGGVLRDAGVPLHFLGQSWRYQPKTLQALSRLIDDLRPAAIHAWRVQTLQAISAIGLVRRLPPLVVVDLFAEGKRGWLDRRCACRADFLVETGQFGRARAIRAGIPEDRIRVIPMCVSGSELPDRATVLRKLNLPEDCRLIACAGAIEPRRGFREAAWVSNILAYVYPKFWLLMIGDGSDREQVAEFARAGGTTEPRIRFASWRSDAASLLGLAEVIWILGERGGRNVALEALAAGRPVVARRRPDLAEILGDGETGALVDRAERHELARATRRILDHPERKHLFEACAARRASLFEINRVMPEWIRLIESKSASLHLN